ncbi:MAG TPA: hypothetical protein VKZ63_05750 [Kofleriaceae bacterium]|nr:hypothetical protein [Kofleriaceae bacterium]
MGEGSPDAGVGQGGPDAGAEDTCPADPCDLYSQCGCEVGQACDLDRSALATGGTECRDVIVGGQSLANCTADEHCAAGYGCFGSPGQCRKYCDGENDCGFGHCIVDIVYDAGGGETVEVPGATLCTKACKPESATGSGCPQDPAFGCFFYYHDPNGAPDSGDELWFTDCRPAASSGGGHNADCSARGDSDCAPGYNCLQVSYGDGTKRNQCRQTCVWTVAGEPGERACNGNRVCASLGIVIGDTEYGYCKDP